MKQNKFKILSTLIIACSVSIAFGFVVGGSNLGPLGYPKFESTHYNRPMKPYSKDEYAVRKYKQEVERYIEESKEYVKAANSDIERIQEGKSDAIRSANVVVDEYNNYIQYGH